MKDAERLRRRRCLALRVAVLLGILLAVVERRWGVAAVALAGIVLALAVYWRTCRQALREPAER